MDENIRFKQTKGKNGNRMKIICPEYLGIANVPQCRDSILENANSWDGIQIDASKIQRSDACGVQLLYSLVRWCQANDKEIKWIKPSEVLQRSANLMGLSKAMLLKS